MRNRAVFTSVCLLLFPIFLFSQVTTSTLSGTIRSATEALEGATVTATHLPTATVFATSSLKGGVYTIVILIPGGPYRIEVTYVGYQTYISDSAFLPLGENTRLDVSLTTSGADLAAVVVSGSSAARRKTGASTNISRQTIASLPTLSRRLWLVEQ